MEMISNIGPVAIAVLVILLFTSLYSWTIILRQDLRLWQSHQR